LPVLLQAQNNKAEHNVKIYFIMVQGFNEQIMTF